MKAFTVCRYFALVVAYTTTSTSSAWSIPPTPASSTQQPTTTTLSRQQFFLQGLSCIALVGSSSCAAATTLLVPTATAATPFDPSTFSHQYSDPKHPNCKRIVVIKADGTAAISGTDGNPGCPEDGSGNVWRLVGEVEGNKLLVDFSPKVRIFGWLVVLCWCGC